MSKQTVRRPTQKRRPQARKGRTVVAAKSAGRRTDRTSWIIAAIVIAVGGALVFVFAGAQKGANTAAVAPITGREKATASLVSKVTGVKDSVITGVGAGSVGQAALPKRITGQKPLVTKDGKPRVVYLGAEYCPYCATERWAMVQALSRFGTFKNLQITTSSSADVDPSTPTFSFHGATYTSPYIQFEPVEQQDNAKAPLETPTAEQAQLEAKFDAPPYVTAANAGAIPFISFANQYFISGATYSPDVLQGKSFDDIAAGLQDPNSDIAKGAIGAANAITATICRTTNDKPANVCGNSAVKAISAKLGS